MTLPGFSPAQFKVRTQDGRFFRLEKPVVFTRADGSQVTMPVGTESDGASTPLALWGMLPPFGNYWRAAFLHDAAYRAKTRPIIGSKRECDDLFDEAMLHCGVDASRRQIIFLGVKRFGGHAWLEDRI